MPQSSARRPQLSDRNGVHAQVPRERCCRCGGGRCVVSFGQRQCGGRPRPHNKSHAHVYAGAADATSAEPQQPPLQQGDAQRPKAAPRSTRRSGGRAAEEPPQPEQQQQQGQQQDQQQQQQHDDPWAACLSDSDDDEQDAAGPSVVLDHLAQSIRAAFQSKAAAAGTSKGQAGERRPPQQPQQQPAQDAPGDALHWKPEILPPAAKPSKREVLQVQVPADKPAGLAKQVRGLPPHRAAFGPTLCLKPSALPAIPPWCRWCWGPATPRRRPGRSSRAAGARSRRPTLPARAGSICQRRWAPGSLLVPVEFPYALGCTCPSPTQRCAQLASVLLVGSAED